MKEFYSNGKLLVTGEYAVLDGALSLALPTTFGQYLRVIENNTGILDWKSLDEKGSTWFQGSYNLKSLKTLKQTNEEVSKTLITIISEAKILNSAFLTTSKGCEITTQLTFPRNWGLGSSSTLLNNVAQWASINPYELLWNAFSGSGYDIACAQNNTAITYQLEVRKPTIEPIIFNPPFKDKLYFIHLNKKQNSRDGILQYRNQVFNKEQLVFEISAITKKIINCSELSVFEALIKDHENTIANVLNLNTVKDLLFPDYPGSIKSLGAWGGDFILATGNEKTPEYFISKGFTTILSYDEMILK